MTDHYKEMEKEAQKLAESSEDYIAIPGGGFVRYVDKMGSDSRIVQAARVSYGAGTKTVRDDAALIYHLIRNGHTSPLEMVEICFHIGQEIFSTRQQIRHRTANVNEYSGRYSEMPESNWEPTPDMIRTVGGSNRQGSLPERNPNGDLAAAIINAHNAQSSSDYHRLLALGVPKEQARVVLPLTQMTQYYWKIDGNNFLKFIGLRLDSHAQPEIRLYAQAMWHFFKREFPLTAEAYDRAILQGARLTGPMLATLLRALDLPRSEVEWLKVEAKDSGCSKTETADLLAIVFGGTH